VKFNLGRLTLDSVERKPEIQAWLNQFSEDKRGTATDLLLKLRFVTRDMYAEWLKAVLSRFASEKCAVYAVRKFEGTPQSIWDANGDTMLRPSTSQGSEDMVHSVIANLKKSAGEYLLDHPSLNALREQKIHHVVLIDDSVSGQSKPATSGRMKTSHFEGTIAYWAAWAALGRNEPTQCEPAAFDINFGGQRLVQPADCA
jgi:hypothetical protein